jgi:hypothetical protein
MIGEQPDKRALFIRARIEDCKQRENTRVVKCHCLWRNADYPRLRSDPGQAGIEYDQSSDCHNRADEEDAPPHTTSNNSFTSRPGRLIHQARIRRIDAKRQRVEVEQTAS